MQRLHIFVGADGESHWAGLTPEALNQFGARVSGSARMDIVDAPASTGPHPAARPELVVVLSGVHEFGAVEGKRRLFPGDVVVLDDVAGQGHTFDAIGKERAMSLRFPLDQSA